MAIDVYVHTEMRTAMQSVTAYAARGYVFWTRGRMHYAKIARFAQKMHEKYHVYRSSVKQAQRKAQGKAVSRLILIARWDSEDVDFFLMATAGRGPVHECEKLQDLRTRQGRLSYERMTLWSNDTASADNASPRATSRRCSARASGVGEVREKHQQTSRRQRSRFTWRITRAEYEFIRFSATHAASLGDPHQVNDIIYRLNQLPGYRGVRVQRDRIYKAICSARVRALGADTLRQLDPLKNHYVSFGSQKLVRAELLNQWFRARSLGAETRRLVAYQLLSS